MRELRTPQILIYLVQSHAGVVRELASTRALLAKVLEEDFEGVIAGLEAEERREREADRAYWRPLKEELERIRHAARLNRPPP